MPRKTDPNNILTITCPICGKSFQCKKWKPKRFCSKICANNSPEVKEKNRVGVKAAFDEKYGGHPMVVSEDTKNTFKKSMLSLHGVEWAGSMKDHVDKSKQTLLTKYGNAHYNNMEKMKSTMLEKYGVDNYKKTEECKEKYKVTCSKKYGVEHASKSIRYKDSHKKLMFTKFTESKRFENFVPKFTFEEYHGVTKKFNRNYPFQCKRCGNVEEHDLCNGKDVKCSKCDKNMSGFQLEVVEYIKSLLPEESMVTNNRAILSPFEIDIYVPNKNIGIETDGLYWHTEVSGGKNKNYHLNKTKMASTKGIRLIHIFENEWRHKKEIVKSVLHTIFTKQNTIIYARNCEIKEIPVKEKSEFLMNNHLQGNDHSTVKIGLYHKSELVSVMTFVKSRFDRSVEWELSRFCTKLNTTVVGGSSRIFSHFVKNFKPKTVVSYSDRRYFSGETYFKLGFQFVNNTPPNYHYTIDGYIDLQNRINWQKAKLSKKLVTFDPSFSEWENMKVNGFDRIWDCGHSKWVWTKKSA